MTTRSIILRELLREAEGAKRREWRIIDSRRTLTHEILGIRLPLNGGSLVDILSHGPLRMVIIYCCTRIGFKQGIAPSSTKLVKGICHSFQ
ncbi:hypothetical protein CEXT_87651 [Caerostris extrusa]|uniref:Uncharacterized protein n=1 Tax=Caerostris extrusa TaxID=172846 RepID=A0AAV4Y3Z4_CAEEX|nr:hypothetical protein CEXT_87651 [Caerostris extrusa]